MHTEQMNENTQDPHQPLRADINLLGRILGETIREQTGEQLFGQVEKIRELAKAAREQGDHRSLQALIAALNASELVQVARSFGQFLNYANIAEQHHRVRRRRQYQMDAKQHAEPGSLDELLPRLLHSGCTPKQVIDCISTLSIELVMTPHPTEVTRRTLRHKYSDIARILGFLDRTDITKEERLAQLARLRRRIIAAWHSDEIRRAKPTPVNEAKWGFTTVERTLWDALPALLRKLDRKLQQHLHISLPATATPIRFASWMGGDRDGNPYVTADLTAEVLLLARWKAADLLLRNIGALRHDLSMLDANEQLRAVVDDHPEPYRELLRQVSARLVHTRDWATACLQDTHAAHTDIPYEDIYYDDQQLLQPLLLIRQSLIDCNMAAIADGSLIDIIRRVQCFGMTLLCLDIRQEADRHTRAVAAIAELLGHQDYAQLDEAQKQAYLLQQLQTGLPLSVSLESLSGQLAAEDLEVLSTFRLIAQQPAAALGAYIISMASAPSDILAVRWLQLLSGSKEPQRIVPLFETLDDLRNAADSLRSLFAIAWYRDDCGQRQEVMIGYSDSAKDAGFLTAAWAQFQSIEEIIAVCAEHAIELTLFHGRGGSVSRGGGPLHPALLAQPQGAVPGRVRVTEQGEVIDFKFGLPDIAMRNLELYTTATLEATLLPAQTVPPRWRTLLQSLSATALVAYRQTVHSDARLPEYYRQSTPGPELSLLELGSRPASRKPDGGIESLRAIPWVFAWTQIRLMLPAWYGMEVALQQAANDGQLDELREMASNWGFFRMLMDMQEMVLAKSDSAVAACYERSLVNDPQLQDLGEHFRQQLGQAISAVEVINQRELLADHRVLRRSIDVRNPYVYPLHMIQIEAMRRLRRGDEDADGCLQHALQVAITGIAAGLRNTG